MGGHKPDLDTEKSGLPVGTRRFGRSAPERALFHYLHPPTTFGVMLIPIYHPRPLLSHPYLYLSPQANIFIIYIEALGMLPGYMYETLGPWPMGHIEKWLTWLAEERRQS